MGIQAVSALSTAHAIERAAAIELLAALAQAENRALTQAEGKAAGSLIELQFLRGAAVRALDPDRERARLDTDTRLAAIH
jgi:hypothetical protein